MASPPRVRWTFHGSAVVRDYHATMKLLGRLVGCRPLEYFDDYSPLVARRGGMTWLGDNSLEIMEPLLPEGGPGKFLARFGPGMFALALQVENAPAAADWFRGAGAGILGDPAQGFFFTHPKDSCGIYLEWADMAYDNDPRFGRELPQLESPPLIDAQRIAYWGALTDDPMVALDRLQQLWPGHVLLREPEAGCGRPAAAISLGDGVLVLFRAPPEGAEMQRLWGTTDLRPRMLSMSFRVADLPATVGVLRAEGIRILRGSVDEGEIVTHPDDTCGLVLTWTDRLLPGDPRA